MLLRTLILASLVVFGWAGFSLAEPPAVVQLDQAKTLRLGKLLENLQVLSELKISDEAYARLEDVKDQERGADRQHFEALRAEMDASQQLPAAQRAERMRAFSDKFQAARSASGENFAVQRFNLLSGPQMQRLSQLDLQDQGIGAFFQDEVATALKLTADQQQKIEAIQTAYEAKFRPLLKGPIYTEAIVLRSTQPAMVELVKERTAKLDEVLSKDQREKLADLRGEPFEQAKLGRALGEMMDLERIRPRISSVLQGLLPYESVRKELKLTPEAEAGIDAAVTKHREAILSRAKDFRSQQEGAEKLTALQRALHQQEHSVSRMQESRRIEKEFTEELGKHITDAQLERLAQINRQRGGRYAVGFGGREELGLTTEQQSKVMEIQMKFMRQPEKPPAATEDAAKFFQKQMDHRKEMQKKEDAEIMDVLTAEQRQKLKELQGPPFDVSTLDASRSILDSPRRTATPLPAEKPKQP